jgi:hypothetical protein
LAPIDPIQIDICYVSTKLLFSRLLGQVIDAIPTVSHDRVVRLIGRLIRRGLTDPGFVTEVSASRQLAQI